MLHALREFKPTIVIASTYQAISGAGKTFKDWPEIVDNVIPYIGGEEAKSEQEPLRIWGHIENGVIVKAESPIITSSACVYRFPTAIRLPYSCPLRRGPRRKKFLERWAEFKGTAAGTEPAARTEAVHPLF